jgi:D-glycero-D-manno-heptose 1,7-bisphosphate phosphatase
MRPGVFLDRDDTLIANRSVTTGTPFPGDLFDPTLVRLLPGVAEGLRLLAAAGYALVVVSNQGAVARGRCTLAQVHACNERLRAIARAEAGVEFAGVYVCPYHPKGTTPPWNIEHPWRKPGPGMLLAAARDLGLDLARSWLIGDAQRDIDAALAAGIPREHALRIEPEGDFLGAARTVRQAGS